ncbi:MAG: hypothetical protein JWP27_930 [Flaviaesturariibacter sp.]|nr:hypothetical protein [Flaviaesturariibacter sp.]
MRSGLLLLPLLVLSMCTYSQRPVSACPLQPAGPDVSICSGQSTRIGRAAVPGLFYQWTGPGLSDAAAAQPSVSLAATTTYTLNTFDAAANLLDNGNFAVGSTGAPVGWTPQLTAFPNCASGCYAQTASPSSVNATWCSSLSDATPGGGTKMLVANGSSLATNTGFYHTSSLPALQPNTTYLVTAQVAGLKAAPGAPVRIFARSWNGSVGASNNNDFYYTLQGSCSWERFQFTFTTGSAPAGGTIPSTLTIGLVTPGERQVALDEVKVIPACAPGDQVTVTVGAHCPTISPAGPIDVYAVKTGLVKDMEFTSSESSGNQWYVDDQPVPGATGQSFSYQPQIVSDDYQLRARIRVLANSLSSNEVVVTWTDTYSYGYPVAGVMPSAYCPSAGIDQFDVEQVNLGPGAAYKWEFWQGSWDDQLPQRGLTASTECLQVSGMSSTSNRIRVSIDPACYNANERLMCLQTTAELNGRMVVMQEYTFRALNCRTAAGIALSPNPARDKVVITAPAVIQSVQLVSMTSGARVSLKPNGTKELVVHTSTLAPGYYSCVIQTRRGVETVKLLVSK